MKARPLFLCLLAALCAIPAPAQDGAKPATAPAEKSGAMEKRRQELLKRFDLNGDGKLDDAEKAAMKEAQKQQRTVRGSGDIGSLSATGEPGPGGEPPRADLFVRELLKRFDQDGDGKLDAAELTEMMKARAAAGGQGMNGGPGGQFRQQMLKMFDKNGDGRLDDDERAAAEKFREDQVKRFDRNGDGQLDPGERAEAMKAFLTDHPELMPPGN